MPGVDFVLTSREDGVLGPPPAWLFALEPVITETAEGDSRFPAQVSRQVLEFKRS